MKIRWSALSHVGKKRSENQDAGYASNDLLMVADGMGGHTGGALASRLAILAMVEAYRNVGVTTSEPFEVLLGAYARAEATLRYFVQDQPQYLDMGTTLTCLAVRENRVEVLHIGDSRLYVSDQNSTYQVSEDHTLVQSYVNDQLITMEQSRTHPQRSTLLRVLGACRNDSPDYYELELKIGQRVLLASDGLNAALTDMEIAEILQSPDDVDVVADRLIKATLNGGAPDNVTCVVGDVVEDFEEVTTHMVGSAAEVDA